MIYLTFGLGGICHDRPGLLAAGLGFPLELRHGRGIVAGLRMRPIGTRHTLLCHRITSGQSIAANRVRINTKKAAPVERDGKYAWDQAISLF